MDKQELIKRYEVELKDRNPFSETVSHSLMVSRFLDDLKQLDEPQKVTVPQFVADWYEEYNFDLEFNIWDWIKYTQEEEKIKNRQFTEWLGKSENDPVETLVKMKLFGYDVEEEKRYRVSLKNGQPLLKAYSGKALYFSQDIAIERCKVTRKELDQAGFAWVLDCPGIEIEEVAE